MTSAPKFRKISATVVLPQAMPPVSPTTNFFFIVAAISSQRSAKIKLKADPRVRGDDG
jgi:hypothetical protein